MDSSLLQAGVMFFMWVRRVNNIVNDDMILTIKEFRAMVNDVSTPLYELLSKTNQQTRVEFVPLSVRNIAYTLAERSNTNGCVQNTGIIRNANSICDNTLDMSSDVQSGTGYEDIQESSTESDES